MKKGLWGDSYGIEALWNSKVGNRQIGMLCYGTSGKFNR